MDPTIGIGIAYAGACIMAGLAVIGGSVGLGILGSGLVNGIARQPEQVGQLSRWFFIALAFVEGLAIIIIALAFVFPTMAQGAIEALSK